ncbi:hypothetical protein [uncultured Thermomonospora sp.]|uniref:hypothetical protein n=1 Tax=uncultured Thermomonospora sp. TaxID=671175 RepID=UPI00259B7F14|nr:hypothetical protein [uncultured Thermomonospora sp.]
MSDTHDGTVETAETADERPDPQEGREQQTFGADYVKKLREEAARYRTELRRLKGIEEAYATEQTRAEKAEQRAAAAEARALRRQIALEHRLSAEDAALLDAVVDEEAIRALAERLAQGKADAGRARDGAYVPSEGRNTTTPALNSDQLEQALRAKLGIA